MTLSDKEKEDIVLQATVDFLQQSPASPLAAVAATAMSTATTTTATTATATAATATTATATMTTSTTTSQTDWKNISHAYGWKVKQLSGGYTNAAYQVYYNHFGDSGGGVVEEEEEEKNVPDNHHQNEEVLHKKRQDVMNNASALSSLAATTTPTTSPATSLPQVPSVFCKLAFRNTSILKEVESTDLVGDENEDDDENDDHKDDNVFHQQQQQHHHHHHEQHVWNHQRTNCEYQIMQYIQNNPHLRHTVPIPVPYACLNVGGGNGGSGSDNNNKQQEQEQQQQHSQTPNCKLLLTEWIVCRQVWAEQFLMVGHLQPIDRHLITQVATAFASLNAQQRQQAAAHSSLGIDKDFNPSGRAYQASVMPVARQVFLILLQQQQQQQQQQAQKQKPQPLQPAVNRVATCIQQQFGADVCEQIANAMEYNYMHDRQCLVHGDAHAFNVLVVDDNDNDGNDNDNNKNATTGGAKSKQQDTTTATTIRIIDWELCMVGPVGRDIGLLMGWPIACALWHAHQCREKIAFDILALVVDLLWPEYAKQLVQNGIEQHELAYIYRNGLAWCGWFLFVSLYVFGVAMEHFTYEMDTEEEHEKVLESIGMVGLQLMRLGFYVQEHPNMSLHDLQRQMKRFIEAEIRGAHPLPPRFPPRKQLLRPRRKPFPPILRSLSVMSWSSLHSFELSESDEEDVYDASNEDNNTRLRQQQQQQQQRRRRTQSHPMLPRHCMSAITDGETPPEVLTPTGSSLPFVIPVKSASKKPKTFKFIYR